MAKHHPKNERIKRDYAHWLEDARQLSRQSVDAALGAIIDFERSTGRRDFAAFHYEQARAYKRKLAERRDPKSGKPFSKATITGRLKAVRAFFIWLAGQPSYRSKINGSDADYFNPSRHELKAATASTQKPGPTLEQMRRVIEAMPHGTDIEKRDRAIVAFIMLTGARDLAVVSLKLKHVEPKRRFVLQDGKEVATKFRKTIHTTFFPVGEPFESIVLDWIDHLTSHLLYGPDDPLFPQTLVRPDGAGNFAAAGLSRSPWADASPIRAIFKRTCAAVGLPYFNPHSLRKTLGTLGERTCRTPEEFKAWSQNLGHEQVLTTYMSYGTVSADRQIHIMSAMADRGSLVEGQDQQFDAATVKRVLDHLSRSVGA